MKTPNSSKNLMIAGPCSMESTRQARISMQEAKLRGVDYVRMSLWKPRTKPGFDGLKEAGIPLLTEAASKGLNPSTEVLVPQQAQAILDAVLPVLGNGSLLLWIGARNQNHYLQQEIARVVAQDKRVKLMLKNQPWPSESHWEGIAEHALEGGILPENLWLCHRGFIPGPQNPAGLRNVPDHEVAMRVKAKTGLTMIFDPSHTAGASDTVAKIAKEADAFDYDGMIIEVHPTPKQALTDAAQQLTWEQFDALRSELQPADPLKWLELAS